MTSSADLLNLVGIGQRASEVRFDLLDRNLSLIGSIQPDLSTPGTVAVDTTRAIMRTLTNIQLNSSQSGEIDVFADRLRPVWVLENGAEFPLGVFLFGSVDRTRWEWGLDATISCVDQTLMVDQATDKSVSCTSASSIHNAIVAQLATAGVPSIDVDPGITVPVGAPIAWPAGESRLKIINDLAALAGALPLYFDSDGVATVRLASSGSEPHVYDSGGRILSGSMVESDSLLDVPNQYIVIDSGSKSTIVGSYLIPADAPNSSANRGFVASEVITEQGLGGKAQANERARMAYVNSAGGYELVQFSSPPDPRHDTFDDVLYLGGFYRERGWSLPLVEGAEMTHNLQRRYEEPVA